MIIKDLKLSTLDELIEEAHELEKAWSLCNEPTASRELWADLEAVRAERRRRMSNIEIKINDQTRHAATAYEHALSFLATVSSFMDSDHLVWLKGQLAQAAIDDSPHVNALIASMEKFVEAVLADSQKEKHLERQ